MIRCEIITKQDEIFQYRKAWNSLFESGDHEASTSFEWTYALLTTHLEKNDLFLLMVLREAEDVVGIIPLIISETKKYGQSIKTLFPISEYYNTHSDLLLKDKSYQLIDAFINHLYKINYKWDVFRVGRFVQTNPIMECIETCLRTESFKYRTKKEEPSFYIKLDDTYDLYLRKRSSKFRNYLKRMKKKLASLGMVKIVCLEDFGSIVAAYEQLLHVEKKSWKHAHGTAISNVEKQEKFYRKLCEGEYQTGRLHLFFLYLNESPIAYNLGLIRDNKYLYLKTSFDEEFKKTSPATVLRAELVNELISKKIEYFDFPGEPYEWEQQWADDFQYHNSLIIYNSTLKANLFAFYNNMSSKGKKTDSEDQIHYHNPIDLRPEKY